mmetsp:Transcript_37457/g.69324  ORF Transcript_37457/g.69324 Transcript_37457/m.69324 type:complete len:80 (-) Transcript_37457:436-675(-)
MLHTEIPPTDGEVPPEHMHIDRKNTNYSFGRHAGRVVRISTRPVSYFPSFSLPPFLPSFSLRPHGMGSIAASPISGSSP